MPILLKFFFIIFLNYIFLLLKNYYFNDVFINFYRVTKEIFGKLIDFAYSMRSVLQII